MKVAAVVIILIILSYVQGAVLVFTAVLGSPMPDAETGVEPGVVDRVETTRTPSWPISTRRRS